MTQRVICGIQKDRSRMRAPGWGEQKKSNKNVRRISKRKGPERSFLMIDSKTDMREISPILGMINTNGVDRPNDKNERDLCAQM